jgi:dCTP deaminase
MSSLSDRDILAQFLAGDIKILDFDPNRLQAASYDICLGQSFLYYDIKKLVADHGGMSMRVNDKDYMIREDVEIGKDFCIPPNGFALGVVQDRVGTNSAYYSDLLGKSSIARKGLAIHAIAGFIDPGNYLNITLEFFNLLPCNWYLTAGMKIGQIRFDKLTSPAVFPYGHKKLGSKYLGSTDVQASEYLKNYPTNEIPENGILTAEFCKSYGLEDQFLKYQESQPS